MPAPTQRYMLNTSASYITAQPPLTFGDNIEIRKRDVLELPGLVGTVEILEFLSEHKTARYTDFDTSYQRWFIEYKVEAADQNGVN